MSATPPDMQPVPARRHSTVYRIAIAQSPANSTGKEKRARSFDANPLIRFLFLARLAGFEPTTPWFVALKTCLSD